MRFMYVENNNYKLINYHEWCEKYPWSNYEQINISGERIAKTASIRSANDGDWYIYFDTKPCSGGELRMSLNNDVIHFYKNYDDVEVPSEFGVGWGDSITFDPIDFGYDDPSILELADGWEILDLVDTILIERSYSGMYSAGYEKSAGSNPEDYITKDDLTDVFEDDDVLYYVGRSPEDREIGIEIDWNTHDLEYVCTIDRMPYTSVGVYDFIDEDGKYFDEAVKALSVCVFELEHGVKFPRDYWGRPIIGSVRRVAAMKVLKCVIFLCTDGSYRLAYMGEDGRWYADFGDGGIRRLDHHSGEKRLLEFLYESCAYTLVEAEAAAKDITEI